MRSFKETITDPLCVQSHPKFRDQTKDKQETGDRGKTIMSSDVWV